METGVSIPLNTYPRSSPSSIAQCLPGTMFQNRLVVARALGKRFLMQILDVASHAACGH